MREIVFSIIVPVYNVEKYISYCMESLLNQKFDKYEILLVDDGSTDNSGSLCDKYENEYPDVVRTIHKSNGGQISARFEGINNAHGDYVIFVDSDDFVRSDMLNVLNNIIIDCNPDVCIYKWKKADIEGNLLNEEMESIFISGEVNKLDIIRKVVSTSVLNSLCIKCCKREFLLHDYDKATLNELRNGEDLIQSLPMLFGATRYYYVDEPLYYYRVNPESVTHNYQSNQYRALNIVRPLLYEYLVNYGYVNDFKNQFYSMYLDTIFQNIIEICKYESKNFVRVFTEISDYKMVVEAKEYIADSELGFLKKCILKLFYLRMYGLIYKIIHIKYNLRGWKEK